MAARSLRWVKDVLSRSIRLQHKRTHGQAAEKGRGPAVDPATTLLMEQRADLGARLLVHDPATQLVRNLFVIHDELGARGRARTPEVSETNYDEYELMERSWVGTVPAGLDLSDRSLPSR